MILSISLFILGIYILILSTQGFIRKAEKIAVKMKMSPLVIGITIVAIGTSLPEFIVSVIAAGAGDPGLALGNIVGSNITNILLVMPVAVFVGRLRIGTQKTQKSALFLLSASIFYASLYLFFPHLKQAGLILIFTGILFTMFEYRWGEEERRVLFKIRRKPQSLSKIDTVNLVLSVAGIGLGGLLTVIAIENLARITGISTTIFGLTLTAVATSLPELLTTVMSQKDKEEKMTIGNIIGSNIYNILFIGGVLLLVGGRASLPPVDWMIFLAVSLAFAVLININSGKIMHRLTAALLVGMYAFYIFFLASG